MWLRPLPDIPEVDIKQKILLRCRRPLRLSFAEAKSYHILLSFVIYCSVGRTSIEIGICRKLCLFGQYIVSASLNLQLSGNPCWYYHFAISIGNCFPSTHTYKSYVQSTKIWKVSNCTDDLFLKCLFACVCVYEIFHVSFHEENIIFPFLK